MDRVSADVRSDHHWQTQPCIGSQVPAEVRHCLVDVFLWQLFPDGLQAGDFRFINRLIGFGWSLWYFSSMVSQTWQSSISKSGEFGGHSFFLVNPGQFAEFCVMLERR